MTVKRGWYAKGRSWYPWRRWLRVGDRVLMRGRHFAVAPKVMAQLVRNRACREGLRVSLAVGADRIKVRVTHV